MTCVKSSDSAVSTVQYDQEWLPYISEAIKELKNAKDYSTTISMSNDYQKKAISIGPTTVQKILSSLNSGNDSVTLHFEGDEYKTTFKMIDGNLRAFDYLHPEGRMVLDMVDFLSTEGLPTSAKGVLMKHLKDMNKETGGCDAHDLAFHIDTSLTKKCGNSIGKYNNKMMLCIAASIMAKVYRIQVNFNFDDGVLGFAIPPDATDKHMSAIKLWSFAYL
jgi:hypothetical protein